MRKRFQLEVVQQPTPEELEVERVVELAAMAVFPLLFEGLRWGDRRLSSWRHDWARHVARAALEAGS